MALDAFLSGAQLALQASTVMAKLLSIVKEPQLTGVEGAGWWTTRLGNPVQFAFVQHFSRTPACPLTPEAMRVRVRSREDEARAKRSMTARRRALDR